MIYYATHDSGRLGSDYSHVIKAKNDRGAKQALRMRSRHWLSGTWVLSSPVNQNRPYGDVRVIALVSN